MFNFIPDPNSTIPTWQQYTDYENAKILGTQAYWAATLIPIAGLVIGVLWITKPIFKALLENYRWRKRYWKEQRELWKGTQ